MQRRERVVIIGAGFGGIEAAKHLDDEAVDVLIIDRNNFHTFQPLLYQVATAGLSSDDIAYPVRGMFRRQRNATFRMGTVVGADLAAGCIELDDGALIEFDSLVIAAGAVTNDYGVPGVAEHAWGMKSVDDAEAIRQHLLRQFERTVVEPELLAEGALNVVIVGGGPTGVELAGGTSELFNKVLDRDVRSLDMSKARVVLVEAADRLLTPFTVESSERAARTLARHGVEVLLDAGVSRVDGHGVVLADGTHLAAGTVIWAAGVKANPLAAALGVERNGRGRIAVAPNLALVEHPNVYAIGDIAAEFPQVAQPAIQGGAHVAAEIVRRRRGEAPVEFVYRDKGSMATIGRNDAVTELPNGWRFDGFIGWVAWLALHLVELVGVRNRLRVLVTWAWNYVTYDRAARLITAPEVRADADAE